MGIKVLGQFFNACTEIKINHICVGLVTETEHKNNVNPVPHDRK